MSWTRTHRIACTALWTATALALPAGCQDSRSLAPDNQPGVAAGPAAAAIDRGQAFLWSRQKDDGSWPAQPVGFPGGSTALAAWALMESGVPADDPRIQKALAWLQETETNRTYTLAVRANAYQRAHARTGDAELRKALRADVTRLVRGSGTGGYTYTVDAPADDLGDKSNSHYAVMGVQAGQAGGLDVPDRYLQRVLKYWVEAQNADGGWPYSRKGTRSTPTMTAAGVATLGFVRQRLDTDEAEAAIGRGLEWLDEHFQASLKDPAVMYYYFLALQRMGTLVEQGPSTGKAWQQAVRDELLGRQRDDGRWVGSWGPDVSTAYAILVLARQQ